MKYQIIEKSNKFGDKRYYIYKKWWIFKWLVEIPKIWIGISARKSFSTKSYFDIKQKALDYIDLQSGRNKYRGYSITVGLDDYNRFIFLACFDKRCRKYKFFGTYAEICKQIDDVYFNIEKNKYNKPKIVYETPLKYQNT